ncbi:hypothetical protein V2J09_001465 [Rumex salicifolius]
MKIAIPNVSHRLAFNATHNWTSSRWLIKQVNPRSQGCWYRPWICRQGQFPPQSVCCMNRCVNITSDVDNCGLCGFRCKFGHKCCSGMCVDLNRNPFHCGKCFNRCRFGVFCTFGMCGYNEPPFPPKPPRPFPPFPPKPPHPFPPFPPITSPTPPTCTPPSPPIYAPPSPPYLPPYGSPPYSPPPSLPYAPPYAPPYDFRMSNRSISSS